jgi:uncharacterized membrane protein YbhN (UPF0104 family)
MSRAWAWLRLLGGVAVLAVLLWVFGTGPFVDAWQETTWQAVLVALVLTALATLSSAWRWRVVARSIGAPLTVRESITAYYRSQFLNSVLPGGLLGDAHRAVRHGRSSGAIGTGVRATMWDRLGGQVVQVAVAVLALMLLPTAWRGSATGTVAIVALVAVLAVFALVVRRRSDAWPTRDLRSLLRPSALIPLVVASVGTTAAHLAVLLVALRTVGVHASPQVLTATGLVVLVGSGIPLNVAGWGPREGVTAWAFGFVGLGASVGLTVSVVYGVLAAFATLPGVLVLTADVLARRRTREEAPAEEQPQPVEAGRG